MKEKLIKLLKFLVFLSIGVLIFWWVYKDQNFDQFEMALKKADYFWIGIALVLSLLSHLSRAIRWNLLINPLGYYPKILNSFFAVLIMYVSNMAFPRSGEVARCTVLKRYENVPISKSLGTVVAERSVDLLMQLLLFAIVLITQLKVILKFLKNNPEVKQNISEIFNLNTLIYFIAFIGIISLIILIGRKKFKTTSIYLKIMELIKDFWSGIATIKRMKKKWEFVAHTIFIWLMYFLMIYVSFFSFEFTSHLSVLAGLTIFVMASFGMIAPSPGGIGTWHFMAIETLVIYGIHRVPDANAFAFAVHGSMTLLLVIAGSLSFILLPLYNNKKEFAKVQD